MPTNGQLFEVFQCIDDYLAAQETLGSALKDGLFNIARGKYALGSSLGQQRYPGDMQATALIDSVQPAHEDVLYDTFELRRCRRTSSDAGALKKQASTGAEDDTAQPDTISVQRRSSSDHHSHISSDPVMWFAALPPPPVRQAQKDFLTVLQRAVAAVNSVQRLQQMVEDYTAGQADNSDSTPVSQNGSKAEAEPLASLSISGATATSGVAR